MPETAIPERTGFFRTRYRPWPCLAIAAVVGLTAWQLHHQGRRWWCACRRFYPWVSDAWSSHTSQHLFDPYSFTHILHGVVFCGLFAWLCPRVYPAWRLFFSICLACAWELFENSAFVIQRYRNETASLDYEGDSVGNSLGDVLSCAIGFMIARRIGYRKSIVLFLVVEGILLLWIRDDLLLSVVMLIFPIKPIKTWQMGH